MIGEKSVIERRCEGETDARNVIILDVKGNMKQGARTPSFSEFG